MMGSRLIWRMAWSNLARHWKQTLLTLLAGTIGAMLIAVSFVNYDSIRMSSERWMETRLGPVRWKLVPGQASAGVFNSEDIEALNRHASDMQRGDVLLPYVSAQTAVQFGDTATDNGQQPRALHSVLLLGFPSEAAARFDPQREGLWSRELKDDEVLINESAAKLLGARAGDAVKLMASGGEKLLRVREVTEERGLTGYREYGGYSGTVIASEVTVRQLAGIENEGYPAVLAGNASRNVSDHGMFTMSDLEYQIHYMKADFRSKVQKLNVSIVIGFIGSVAVISSMLFMRQTLVMTAESRREMYGVLRAIGLTRGQIGKMFAFEALLLSLLNAIIGTAAGIGAGFVLVMLFYGQNGELLQRMTGEHILIKPYISLSGAGAVFALVFIFLAAVSLAAAAKAGKMNVAAALRGETSEQSATERTRGRKQGFRTFIFAVGIFVTVMHFAMTFIVQPGMDNGQDVLWVIFSWLTACCIILLAVLYGINKMGGLLSRLMGKTGIPRLSVMLAAKYPRSQMGRTYSASLLFALIMMLVSFTAALMTFFNAANAADYKPQTVLGNGAYIAYSSEEEKERLLSVVEADSYIAQRIKGVMTSEPFMVSMNRSSRAVANAVVPVTEELMEREKLPLVERAPQFADDDEAWKTVLIDQEAIILPYSYKEENGMGKVLEAGQTVSLPVYEYKKLIFEGESRKEAFRQPFLIAGFAPMESERFNLMDFYHTTYVNGGMLEAMRPHGFKWPNQTAAGYILVDLDYRNLELVQQLEERFVLNGVIGFTVPSMENAAGQLVNRQYGNGFLACAIFTGLISLMGLAIVQNRTVLERKGQISMMRCVGVPGRQIGWMFVLEGIVISGAGLLTGWGVGASGAKLFIEALQNNEPDYMALAVPYPHAVILTVLAGLLLASVLLNLVPARTALKLKAADALRSSQD